MLCLVLWCGVCVRCGVRAVALKKPSVYVQNFTVCTGTTHKRVSTCARGAGKHGDVLNAHTGTCGVDTRVEGGGGRCRRQPRFFIGKTSVF